MTSIETHEVRAGEYELNVMTAGMAGPPLLLVPGITMSAQRWFEAGYVEALAERRRVLAVDPLGHGESPQCDDVEAYRHDKLVARMLAVLDALDVETADVWGYSRGANIALGLTHAHPDRVRSLVYGGNVLFDPRPVLESLGMLPDPAEVDAAHERAMAGDWEAYWQFFPVPIPDATKRDIEGRNHLPSIAAASRAGRLDHVIWQKPDGTPAFACWGTDEIFHGLNLEATERDDLPHATVPGNHATAFDPAGPMLAAVVPWLDAVGA